jgi:hypothetical protein
MTWRRWRRRQLRRVHPPPLERGPLGRGVGAPGASSSWAVVGLFIPPWGVARVGRVTAGVADNFN